MSGETSDPDRDEAHAAPASRREGHDGDAPDADECEPLRVESLHVRRAPGFETESLRVRDLSPGVTVVHGPNASGKTTVSRAIQWLCWPETAPDRAEVRGRFDLGGERWTVDVDRGAATYQREGRPADPPSLPPAEHRDRYALALHDLLQHDVRDADFAAAIERASAGGYDLDAAGDALGFDDSPANRNKGEVRAVEEAFEQWRSAQEELREVEDERDRLPALRSDLEAAREARHRVEVLEQAIDYAEARDDLAAAEERVAAFPDRLEHVDGDEGERVRDLETEIDEWAERRDDAEADREDARRELDAVDLPADGLPDGLLDRLAERRDRLRSLEDEAHEVARQLEAARERRASAREDVPIDVGADALADADPDVWSDLSAFAREADAVAAERRLERTVERWLDGDDAPEADRETLQRGRQALERWLASAPAGTDDAASTATRIGAVAAAALAAAAVAVGALVHPLGYALALVGVGLFWYGRRAGPDATADDRRATCREEFERLDLEPPAEWSESAVRERLLECYDALAEHRLDEERASRREALVDDVGDRQRRERALEERRERLRESLGAAPEATDLDLVAAAEALLRWQERDAEVDGLEAEREEVDAAIAETRDALVADLAPYERADGEYEPVEDAAAAAQYVADLEDRAKRHADAVEQRDRAAADVADAEEKLEALRAERDAIFEAVGLEPGERDRLRECCDRVEAYEAALEERRTARTLEESELADLRRLPGHEPDLEERAVADLREAKREAAATAEAYDELQREISTIEGRVEAAKREDDVEAARADAERALDDLEAQLADDAAAMVGDVLVEHCRDVTIEATRPAVFERARDLLARITRGRYHLDLAADGDAFRAYDAVRERGHALDELSSGTQLQVLLAVRLAFVEHQERGRALPLVLDETLANSDDERARVIVDAVTELARAGRQVLYFTAQGDEVAKWREALADADVGYAEVDLAERRGLDDRVRVPDVEDVPEPTPSPPDPDPHDHASYGDALDVPPFDPRLGAGRAHCWYVVEDVDALAGLLELGVERWGQLQTLFDRGLGHLVADGPDVRQRIERRGRALETFVECWQHGRGERVTRDALEATDAVTETFLADVTELARDVDGDARAVLEGLRDGEVDRFRSDKADELERFFEREGHLDPAEPLDPDELRLRVIATLVEDGLEREAAADEADALLGRLGPGDEE